MALILETGTGIRGANAYTDRSFVTTYLTQRNRATENGWSTATTDAQDAAIVTSTQYIDTRFRARIRGSKAYYFDGVRAIAQINAAANPVANDTLTLGTDLFTFVVAASDFVENDVVIGANLADTLANLIERINNTSRYAQAQLVEGVSALRLTAYQVGENGNLIGLATTSAGLTIAEAFQLGKEAGSQPLEFPRRGLVDRHGRYVLGIPLNLRYATAEYAVRALSAQLYLDPTIDESGRAVIEQFEKVGPIETRTQFAEGTELTHLIRPYPAADRLLGDYLTPEGVAMRG